MIRWHRTRRGDLGLRALGLGACMLSYAAIGHLLRLHEADPAHRATGAFAYFLIAVGFVCASAGCALVMLRRHLFDEVVVSERWRAKAPDDATVVTVPAPGRPADSAPTASRFATSNVDDRGSASRDGARLFLRRSTASVATLRRLGDGPVVSPAMTRITADRSASW